MKNINNIPGCDARRQTSVAQLGARMHYAVPRILEEAGQLYRLHTDCTAKGFLPRTIKHVPGLRNTSAARQLCDRKTIGIPQSKLYSSDKLGIEYFLRLRTAKSRVEEAVAHLKAGEGLARWVAHHLGECEQIYVFSSAAKNILRHCKENGIRSIYEQSSASVQTERALVKKEFETWEGWETVEDLDRFYDMFEENQTFEWGLADRIICGSSFVKDSIQDANGPVQRCEVVPYGVDSVAKANPISDASPKSTGRKLKILIVGSIRLLKGAGYIAKAAAELEDLAQFRWIGKSNLTAIGQNELAQHVELPGQVPRSQVSAHYQWADLMLIASVCEGSATVVYEAVQQGLPVLATPNSGAPFPTGSPVYIKACSVESIVGRISKLVSNVEGLHELNSATRSIREHLSFTAYAERLIRCINAS